MPCLTFPHAAWWVEALRCGGHLPLYTGPPVYGAGYRNRYAIATANGPLLLSIPLKGGRRQATTLNETQIDYTHGWQRQHWRTLFSAYGRAPFFDHYGPELEALLFAGHERLADFNLAGIEWLGQSMRLEITLSATAQLDKDAANRYRQPARPDAATVIKPYHQVFAERTGFLPNLSAIDLLMTEGPYAGAWLREAMPA